MLLHVVKVQVLHEIIRGVDAVVVGVLELGFDHEGRGVAGIGC